MSVVLFQGYGETALMWAAREGHLEICRLLIDRGCKIDTTQVGGWTALMLAAMEGHLEICHLLIDTGCKINITDSDGETALHSAAEEGYLQITRCLVEQGGASPLIKSHKGNTPYDLAAARRQKEVMEYLQTVMSEKSSGVSAKLRIEDEMVPTEIKLMADKRSIDLYLKLLESGSEKKRDIRLVVVGKKGAGKTSLIRRLFGEDITDVTSTNGIEIHKIKCKAMSDDGIWNKLDGTNGETEIHARLLKPFKGTIEASVEGAHKAVKENTPSTSFDESETVTQQPKKMLPSVTTESQVEPPVTTESQVEPPVILQQRNQALEQAKMEIEAMLKSNVDLHDKEEYATLLLWDFAGDKEFYHTHQTFLSQDAIYLVVTKLNEADDKKAKDMFQLWMNSIHCYCSTTEVLGSIEEKNKCLYPPVVLVGTHKDKVEVSEEVKIEDACRNCLDKYAEDVSAVARRHISDKYEYFISNTEDNPSVFQLIRQNLLNLATTMRTWNKDYPIKFIQLEKCLREKKKELPIISFNEIKQISTEIPKPLNHEELMLYLKFHHELRALVYFEDLSDYIILDTQWLSDAFKCIITAEKFQSGARRHLLTDEWNDLNIRGILHSVVLENILETNKKIFKFEEKQNLFQHKDHILKVMEKFDIIIRPTVSERDAADTNLCYYIPCMVKDVPDCPIHEQFNVTEKNCTKSTWLCFKFKFLPGHLMNHLIASLSRKYEIAEVPVRGQTKRPIALFRGAVVFKFQKTSKLLVMTYPNVIQIQVWDFGKHCNIERCLFKDIDDFVTSEINTIICKRFKMTTVKFEKMLGCSLAEPECVTGFYEQDVDYFCEMCTETHINEWSDHAPIQLTKISEKTQHVPGSHLWVENTSPMQSTSTKVRVSVKRGKRDYSNISEEPPSKCNLREFTAEQINFTKMGIIVLNILADASYDLLKQDIPNLRPRSDCDITYLYQEHYKLKKHVPSKGWGGDWQKIQITNIAVGDDIERIRLTRNELQHSRAAELGDTRFNELCNILTDLLQRFDQLNKPTRLYTDHLHEILAKTISAEDVQSIENEILEMDIEVEIIPTQ
ncbi:death-associated protein kinase 1-like [Mytilus edulis]|uniref:death-associated protein kinase 1-like n=1 Tax=Mytilus edulis TaxID=6550 RepID=UPI0039F054DB